eukprot:3060951-Amphidinium_carterae.2
MLEAFLIGTKSGLDEEDWLKSNDDIWPLALPREEMKKILASAGTVKWSTLRRELHIVSNYSSFGARLFKDSLGVLAEDAVAAALASSMETFVEINSPSKSDVAKTMQEVMLVIDAIPGISNVPAKRKVMVKYRSLDLECEVTSLQGHVDLFFQSYMRGKATELGKLMPLPGEREIIGNIPDGTPVVSSVMSDAHALRTLLHNIVNAMEPPLNGERIEECLSPPDTAPN